MTSPRTKFYLDKQNAKWSGVCAGIADYTGIDVTLVRIGFVLGTVFGGGQLLLAYCIIAWMAPRSRSSSTSRIPSRRNSGRACAPTRAAPPATSARASATSTAGSPTSRPM